MAWPAGEMRAVVMTAPLTLELQERPIPPPRPAHVLVETAFVGICGTDAELLRGTLAYVTEGLTSYPWVFGHEWSGRVAAVAPDVDTVAPGDRVVGDPLIGCGACSRCRAGRTNICVRVHNMGLHGDYPGAASTYFAVPAKQLTHVPDALPLRHAPLVEPAVTVMHALERVRCRFDDRVAVIGTGTLGLIAVQAVRLIGATVDAIGVEEHGLDAARRLGARALRPDEADADAYTVVLEVSGAAEAAASVPRLLEPGGRAGLIGVPGEPVHGFDTAAAVLKDVEIHCMLGGVRNWARTVELFASGRLDADALVARPVSSDEAELAFEQLMTGTRARPKVMIEFGGGD